MEDGTLRGDLVDQDSESPFLTRGDLTPIRLIDDPCHQRLLWLSLNYFWPINKRKQIHIDTGDARCV